MKWIKKHKILSTIIGVVLLIFILAAAGGSNTLKTNSTSNNNSQNTQSTPKETEKPKLDITAFYGSVQDGMTKAQVVDLASKDPGSCTESEMQGLGKYESCIWYGSLGESAFVSISFKDGVVNSKTKTGF